MSGCEETPGCVFEAGHVADHPCSTERPEKPGEPCRYCGVPVPLDGSSCPRCWVPMTIPLFRAWMAAEGLDTTVVIGP